MVNDILIFTGAGFSKPAGCKLSGEMLEDLEIRSYSSNKEDLFTSTEKKAIKFILSCLEYHARWRSIESDGKYKYYPNIEEFALLLRRIKNRENLLPYPVTGNWSDKIMLLEQEFQHESPKYEKDIYTSIEYKIKTKCYEEWLKIKIKKENLSYLNRFVKFIKEFTQNTKFEIFTLNNDLVLERVFENENALYTGFVSNKWVGFDREKIDDNTFSNSRINYYKLHGSLDWARLSDGTIKRVNNNEENIEIKPFLIFGHGTKIYTVEPFFSLIEQFKTKLKQKKYFLIVGYSFFDPHINNLFFQELNNDPEKMMFIFNPKITNKINSNDNSKFDTNNILKPEFKKEFLEYIQNIQTNPFYTENSEFNISTISTDSFEFLKFKSEEFLEKLEPILGFIKKKVDDKRKKFFDFL